MLLLLPPPLTPSLQIQPTQHEAQPNDQTGERPNDDANLPDRNQLAAGNAMNTNNIINNLPVTAAAVAADGGQMDADMRDTQQVAREAGLPATTPALAAASDAVHEAMANGTSRKVDGVISDFEAFKSEVREKFDMQGEILRELLQKARAEVDPGHHPGHRGPGLVALHEQSTGRNSNEHGVPSSPAPELEAGD